jgi:aryl-alcohol dehydrogenase-like predicted oxidoreductase
MQTRKIGSLDVTVVGLGCNNFGSRVDESQTNEVIAAALAAGLNFFDTADTYGNTKSEEFIGNALRGRRDQAVIATKFGYDRGASPKYLRSACEASLSRLNVECIDLYQLHRPDPKTPIADTLGALNDLIGEGKVREIGCSNFTVEMVREAKAALGDQERGFASIQNQYSLLVRDAEVDILPECRAGGIAFLPYLPLFHGLLTGKYRRHAPSPAGARLTNATSDRQASALTDRNFDIVEALTVYAETRGHTILELALARLIAEPAIASVIAGATSPSQVIANATAGNWILTEDEIVAIDALAPAI